MKCIWVLFLPTANKVLYFIVVKISAIAYLATGLGFDVGAPGLSSMTDLIICRITSDRLATLYLIIPVKLCLSFVMFSSNK